MESKKAKKTTVTPKSAKKNDKSVKTPVSKATPMADTPRPVLSAKKQNGLKAAGKATPNKKGNATPNIKKTPKSESKKKTKKPEKKVEDEEEDDDEDDDSEIELNPEIMKSLAEMSDDDDEDMEEDDDDDDDEDDDEEEEDDEDDDEEEDDDDDDDDDIDSEVENEIQSLDEEQLKRLIKSLKGKDKGKKSKNGIKEEAAKEKKSKGDSAAKSPKKEIPSPQKKNKNKSPAPKKETPAPKAGKKQQQQQPNTKKEPAAAAAAPVQTSVNKEEYLKSVSERDLRTLFLKGLPVGIQEEGIVNLSKDIKSVRIRKRIRRNQKHTTCYAFVEFEDESAAENNFKLLSETLLDDKPITVDYMGSKSLHRPKNESVVKDLDPKKLYITGFPYTTTDIEIRRLFPKAESFVMPIKRSSKKPLGFAFAKFDDAEVCADEMKRLNGIMFNECKLVVVHANLVTDDPESKGVKRKTETVTSKAKKMKLEKAKEEEDDEEDDDDDDDDDDEEDDDEEDEDDDEEEEDDDDDDDE